MNDIRSTIALGAGIALVIYAFTAYAQQLAIHLTPYIDLLAR